MNTLRSQHSSTALILNTDVHSANTSVAENVLYITLLCHNRQYNYIMIIYLI